MEVMNAINSRRIIRSFDQRPLPKELLENIENAN
jgi:nitroreductase